MPVPPRRSELISVIRREEEELRRIGSTWWDDVPGWVRVRILKSANRLLELLLRIDGMP